MPRICTPVGKGRGARGIRFPAPDHPDRIARVAYVMSRAEWEQIFISALRRILAGVRRNGPLKDKRQCGDAGKRPEYQDRVEPTWANEQA